MSDNADLLDAGMPNLHVHATGDGSCVHAFPQPLDQPWGGYVTGLAATVGLDPVEADLFLKGPLYRKA